MKYNAFAALIYSTAIKWWWKEGTRYKNEGAGNKMHKCLVRFRSL